MGVVLFVLVCGYLPFDGHNFAELFNKILKAQYAVPMHVSVGINILILLCSILMLPHQHVQI